MGACGLGSAGPLQHRLHRQLRATADIGAVVHRLGAVGAVFFAAAGLDAQQGSQLDPIARIGGPVHLLGLPEQLQQGLLQEIFDLLAAPVVTQRNRQGLIAVSGADSGG